MRSPETRIKRLTEKVLCHRFLYYVLAVPIASDEEYDAMERKLRKLEADYPKLLRADSPTQTVGSDQKDSYPNHIQWRAWDMLNPAEKQSVRDTFRPPQD